MATQGTKRDKDHPDAKAMKTRNEERAKANEAAMKRMDTSNPTPTQEENDLARMGMVVEKADDGSGPTVITTVVVANQPYDENAEPPDRPVVTPQRARKETVGS